MNPHTLEIYPPAEIPAAEARGEELVYGKRETLESVAEEIRELRRGNRHDRRKAEALARKPKKR